MRILLVEDDPTLRVGIITGTGLGGAGADELRWLAPVRPGDTIRVKVEVLDKRLSSRGGRGTALLSR